MPFPNPDKPETKQDIFLSRKHEKKFNFALSFFRGFVIVFNFFAVQLSVRLSSRRSQFCTIRELIAWL